MAAIVVVKRPDMTDKRLALALVEDRVRHYPEFRDFFVRTFDLDRLGLAEPGYIKASSAYTYALIFIGRSGESLPAGVQIHAIVDALEPIDENVLDTDLWAILRWMVDGIGGPWTVSDLDSTGRLYRIPAALA